MQRNWASQKKEIRQWIASGHPKTYSRVHIFHPHCVRDAKNAFCGTFCGTPGTVFCSVFFGISVTFAAPFMFKFCDAAKTPQYLTECSTCGVLAAHISETRVWKHQNPFFAPSGGWAHCTTYPETVKIAAKNVQVDLSDATPPHAGGIECQTESEVFSLCKTKAQESQMRKNRYEKK